MTSILNPAVPAGAYDQFLPGALPRARAQRAWTPADGPLPGLYLSHGAPPLFDDPRDWMPGCADIPCAHHGRRSEAPIAA